nr:MAG TPA: hypothetical protein [Caudoviricetes sp.]
MDTYILPKNKSIDLAFHSFHPFFARDGYASSPSILTPL